MKTRRITFVALMGALGNLLAFFTIAPTISAQIGLDFSNLPVLIAAIFAGPVAGAVTGLIAGLVPSVFFGFVGGSLGFLGFSASVGKAIYGFAAGALSLLMKPLGRRYGSLLVVPIAVLSFIPEALWIYVVFTVLTLLFLPAEISGFLTALTVPIIVKGAVEIVVIGFFMSALAGHDGFKEFLRGYFQIGI